MESFSENFAAFLKTARGDKSQAEFARQLGITHQATYQRYEAGRVPKGEVLHQIATQLGVSVEQMLAGTAWRSGPANMKEESPTYAGALPFSEMTTEELKGLYNSRNSEYSASDTSAPRKRVLLGLISDIARELQKRIPQP